MSELKRCPFCGERAMITTYLGTTEVDIECCDCSCKITGCNKEDAIKAWNTRKPMQNIVERLEEEKALASKEKCRCVSERNMLQYDMAKGYENGMCKAIKIVKEEM